MPQIQENRIALKAVGAIPVPGQKLERNHENIHGIAEASSKLAPFIGLLTYGYLSVLNSRYDTIGGEQWVKVLRSAANLLTSLVQIPPSESTNPTELALYALVSLGMVGFGGVAVSKMIENVNEKKELKKIYESALLEMARLGELIPEDSLVGRENSEDVVQLAINNHRVVVSAPDVPFLNELGNEMQDKRRSSVLIGSNHYPYEHKRAGRVLWPVWINTEKPDNRKVLKVANVEKATELVIFTEKKENVFLVDADNSDETGVSITQALDTIVEAYRQKPEGFKDTLSTLLFVSSHKPIHTPQIGNIDIMGYLRQNGVPEDVVTVRYIEEMVGAEIKKTMSNGARIAKIADATYDTRLGNYIEGMGYVVADSLTEADAAVVYTKKDGDVKFHARVVKEKFTKPVIAILDTEEELPQLKEERVIPICIQTLIGKAIHDFEVEQRNNHPKKEIFHEPPNQILAHVLEPIFVNKLTHGFLLERAAALEILQSVERQDLENIFALLPEAKVRIRELKEKNPLITIASIAALFNKKWRETLSEKLPPLMHERPLKHLPKKKGEFRRSFHKHHWDIGMKNTWFIENAMVNYNRFITAEDMASEYFHTNAPTDQQIYDMQLVLESGYQLGFIFKSELNSEEVFGDTKNHTVYARCDSLPIESSLTILGI